MRARFLLLSLPIVAALALAPATGLAKKKKNAEAPSAGPVVLAEVQDGLAYKTWEAFQPLVDAAMNNAEDPSALATLFVQAMVARTHDKKFGEDLMGYMVYSSYKMEDKTSETGWTITRRFADEMAEPDAKPRILHGYCGGTAAGNYRDHDYTNCDPELDTVYSAKMQGPNNGRAKYFVTNRGAPRPRPVNLKEENGKWTVYTVSGLMTGVAATAEEAAAKAEKAK